MIKYKIIAVVNILLGLLFTYLLVFAFNGLFLSGASYNYKTILPALFLISAFINCLLAYRLFISKKINKQQFFAHLIITLNTAGWIVILAGLIFTIFAGLFFISLVLLIAYLALVIITLFILSETNKKFAVALFIIAVIATANSITIASDNFEEAYCVAKGNKADPTGQKFVTATKENAESFKDFNVVAGEPMSIHFKGHFSCHHTFSWSSALKESFLLQK